MRTSSNLPLSGAAATYGQELQRGAEYAADLINQRGGILNGRKIELVFEDEKGTPQGGVAAVQKLMSVGRVKAITGTAVRGSVPNTASDDRPAGCGRVALRSTSTGGWENSRQRNRPPRFSTRRASRSAAGMSVTLRMPNEIT